ncbi:hypothetical protein C8J57DRAFT_1137010 [Mycena rebaudengoi]|nr:hypothetical protein C8J57DRAFT_1137010 [Mycena rebaudengoi]
MREITPRKPGWDGWPTDNQLLNLSEKANGLFHYAATALQWIKEQIGKHSKSCQSWVFDQFAQMGIGQLEELYRLILTSFEDIDHPARNTQLYELREDRLCGFRHIIGTILVLHKPLTIHQIIALLADIPVAKLDVEHFLQQFRSVLLPGITASFEEATPQMHKSFRDYIMNAAPTEFRILTGDAHFVTARSCLEVIVKAGSGSDIDLEYSVGHWQGHLRGAVEEGSRWEDERMWNLLGQMVEKAVFEIWANISLQVFIDVAAAGWGLLKREMDKQKVKGISSILTKVKVRGRPTFNGTSTLIGGNCTRIVRLSIPIMTTDFICLKPYQNIWDLGLLEAWEDHQSPSLSPASPYSMSGDSI